MSKQLRDRTSHSIERQDGNTFSDIKENMETGENLNRMNLLTGLNLRTKKPTFYEKINFCRQLIGSAVHKSFILC